MRVCERCSGKGHYRGGGSCGIPAFVKVCGNCHGTGMILLGPEGSEKWSAMLAEVRRKGTAEGWLEEVWVGVPGNAKKAWLPMGTNPDADETLGAALEARELAKAAGE